MSRPEFLQTRCALGTAQVHIMCAVTRSIYAQKRNWLRSMRCYTSATPKAPAGRRDKDTLKGQCFRVAVSFVSDNLVGHEFYQSIPKLAHIDHLLRC